MLNLSMPDPLHPHFYFGENCVDVTEEAIGTVKGSQGARPRGGPLASLRLSLGNPESGFVL